MNDAQLFEKLEVKPPEEMFMAPSVGYWKDAMRRLKKNVPAMLCLVIIFIIAAAALLGPWLMFRYFGYTYDDQDLLNTYAKPTRAHLFGTDGLGRDLFVRVLYGARISLSIGIVASFINIFIGIIYGGISGYFGGKVDNMMMRIVDILYGVPLLLFVILLMVVLKPGLLNIFIALGVVYWLDMARIVRGQILSLKEQEFVLAARVIGASNMRILFRHLLPNTMGPVIVTLTLSIPGAIFSEAFLSYIGLGVSAPMASWGVLASEGVQALRSYPYLLFFPAAAISITILAFNIFGDGLRDALDPRLR